MEIKSVLFDCDGLMFDTENYGHGLWNRISRKHGVILPDDFFVHITGAGRSTSEPYLKSIEGMDRILKEVRSLRFSDEIFLAMEKDSLNKPGLIELSQWLRENGYKTAVCSSSGSHYVSTLLSTVSVRLVYDAVVGGDMVKKAKPDPEIFLLGAAMLNTAPENCLVLEDSKQGILAARAAGMHSVFIKDTIEPDEEMEKAIEFRCDTLNGVIDLLGGSHEH